MLIDINRKIKKRFPKGVSVNHLSSGGLKNSNLIQVGTMNNNFRFLEGLALPNPSLRYKAQ